MEEEHRKISEVAAGSDGYGGVDGDVNANVKWSAKGTSYWLLLISSCLMMLVAFPASSLLFRLYYVHGGSHRWLLTWIGAAGWPITAAILAFVYVVKGITPTPLSWSLILAYAVIGFLSAADNFMFAWSYAYLPASTSSLLSSTSLIFTAIFAYLIIGKKLNAFSFNAVGIMTAGAVILALDSSSDRPSGVTHKQYAIGFALDIAGSALHGLIFALSELLFIKILHRRSFHLVLELQTMTSIFACAFTTIAVVINGDFGRMRSESETFSGGAVAYYMVLIWASISNQLGVLGGMGVLFLTSTLLAGVLNAARVPVTAIASVLCFHDKMSGFKIISLLLTLWSFGSYIYGSIII